MEGSHPSKVQRDSGHGTQNISLVFLYSYFCFLLGFCCCEGCCFRVLLLLLVLALFSDRPPCPVELTGYISIASWNRVFGFLTAH